MLTAANLRQIFDPVVDEILALIGGQVAMIHGDGQRVSGILLVGGFGRPRSEHTRQRTDMPTGQSRYLSERARERFENPSTLLVKVPEADRKRKFEDLNKSSHGSISVLQPRDGWTAVAQGAALRGVDGNLVSSRRSRFNYGVTCNPVFEEGLHPLRSRYLSEYDGLYRAESAMEWYVKKNEDISETRAIKVEFVRHYWGRAFPDAGTLQHRTYLLANADVKAPLMEDGGLTKTVCTLQANLSSVPRRFFK